MSDLFDIFRSESDLFDLTWHDSFDPFKLVVIIYKYIYIYIYNFIIGSSGQLANQTGQVSQPVYAKP
jgi:hypothetical protein